MVFEEDFETPNLKLAIVRYIPPHSKISKSFY